MSRQSKRRLVWSGFILAMLGMLPTAPRPALAGLAALDAFHVGRYHLANGDREEALESFNDALRMNPQFVQAYVARGKLYAEMGQHESALVDLNFALRLQPTHAEAFAYRGYALMSLGQVAKALPDLDMALRLDPSYARVHFLRGQALELLGDVQASAMSIATARRFDPTLDISRVVSTGADGSLGDGGVQLAGGNSPQRTPVMSDLMPAERAPTQMNDPKYVGRLVPFQNHPVLADVAPPARSQPADERQTPARRDVAADATAPTARNSGRQNLDRSAASIAAKIPDITSDPNRLPGDEIASPAKTMNAVAAAGAKSAGNATETSSAGDAKEAATTAGDAPIAITMPSDSETKPEVVVDAVPQQVAVPQQPEKVARQDTEPTSESEVEDEEKLQQFPSVGPPIFVPRDAVAADEPPLVRPASEILRGVPAAELMLPEKPSSVESDRRLLAAVEAARTAAEPQSSGGGMAVVADEMEEPAIAKAEPSAEQVEAAKAAYRSGVELEQAGKISEALAAYQKAGNLNPSDAEAFCRRGHLLMESLRTAEALAEFEQAIAAAPGLANGYFGRAHVRYVTEQYADALFDYSICLRLDDQHAQALIERGHCYAQLGKTSEARADRRAALDLDPSLAKTGPKYAMEATAEAIPTTAMPGAVAFAGDDEAGPVTAASATHSPVIVTDVDVAVSEPAATIDGSAFENLFSKPNTAESGNPAGAGAIGGKKGLEQELRSLTEELSQFPGDKDRYFRRARVYCDLGRPEAALDDLNAVLRFDAGSLEALKLRAEIQTQLRNPEAAADDLSAALEQTPDDVQILLARSSALAELGEVRGALADLDRVLELDPKNPVAFLERSRLHAERGAFAEAQADRNQALRLDGSLR